MTQEKLEQRIAKTWADQPQCCGYPKCDGDLEGEDHSESCPLHEITYLPKDRIAAVVRAELQKAAEIADRYKEPLIAEEIRKLME